MKLERIALFHGASADCQEAAERLRRELEAGGAEVITRREDFDPDRAGLILLLGGDGFLMDSVRALGYPPTPIFGINFGTVGFLMNPRRTLPDLHSILKSKRFRSEFHPVLQATVRMLSGEDQVWLAVNDIVLERIGGQSVRLSILINDVLLNEYSGDGVIIATSAGSTAYNLAAGGPVLHSRLEGMVLTPLYPHRAAPFNSLQLSVVLPLDSRISLAGIDVEKRAIRILADGRPLEGVAEVKVQDSGHRINLLRVESYEFVATLARKFIGTPPR